MKIVEFLLRQPDDEDLVTGNHCTYTTIECEIDNPTKAEVVDLELSGILLDRKGTPIYAHGWREGCHIEPGESSEVTFGVLHPPEALVGKACDDVTLIACATHYAREFHRLGSVDVPSKSDEIVRHSKKVKSSLIEGELSLMVQRGRPDDEGEIPISIRLALRSRSKDLLKEISLETKLIDKDGSDELASGESLDLRAGSIGCLTSTISLKKSQLKGAKLAFELAIRYPVHSSSCEKVSTPD